MNGQVAAIAAPRPRRGPRPGPRHEAVAGEALTVDAEAAARLCGISRATWFRLTAEGRTPAPLRLGRCVRWLKAEVEGWLAAGAPPRDRWEALRQGRRGRLDGLPGAA